MNDEELIWEAYKRTTKTKAVDPNKDEMYRVFEMNEDEYRQWRRDLEDKISQTGYEGEEYERLISLELAVENKASELKNLWQRIIDTVNAEGDFRKSQYHDDLFQMYALAENNAVEYGECPAYYSICIRTLVSNLENISRKSPEVVQFYKDKFDIFNVWAY
jgi:hypothetical protein